MISRNSHINISRSRSRSRILHSCRSAIAIWGLLDTRLKRRWTPRRNACPGDRAPAAICGRYHFGRKRAATGRGGVEGWVGAQRCEGRQNAPTPHKFRAKPRHSFFVYAVDGSNEGTTMKAHISETRSQGTLASVLRDAADVDEAVGATQAAWVAGHWQKSPLARRLANAGSSGQHVSNVQRDVMTAARLAGLFLRSPPQYHFEARGKGGAMINLSCFLPHEVMHGEVQRRGLAAFTVQDLTAATGLGATVRNWAADEDVQVAPEAAIPIGMHADSVQYTSSVAAGTVKNIFVVTFNTLAGDEVQRARRYVYSVVAKDCGLRIRVSNGTFLVFFRIIRYTSVGKSSSTQDSLCDCGCGGFHTFQDLWKPFTWSLLLCRGGRSPSRRDDDSAWLASDAGRMRANVPLPVLGLLQIRGDWEWISTGFRFRHYAARLAPPV